MEEPSSPQESPKESPLNTSESKRIKNTKRAKEVQATEERAGAVYNKAKPKSGGAAKKKERKWLFMVISEDQIIQDKVRQTSYALLKQNALASTAAVTIFLVVKAIRFAKNIFARKKI